MMASPRLNAFWPLLKNAEMASPAARSARAAVKMRAFHRYSRYRRPDVVQQRYGTANEPPPHLGGGKSLGPATATKQSSEAPKALPKIGEQLQRDGEREVQAEQGEIVTEQASKEAEQKKEATTIDAKTPGPILSDPALDAAESEATEKPPGSPMRLDNRPMDSLLKSVPDSAKKIQGQESSPAEEEQARAAPDEQVPPAKAPHIDTPRHVHHFNTYDLVRGLMDAGWSDAQAITIMKAVRLMLADNMELAREALVSKSQVENETYLFRAACAELKTEVTTRRRTEQEKMRTERTQLQHELDILAQRLGQESGSLKDELKGLFDDRKMAVRNEQRNMESKIHRLNYQITVELQADGKSEVEGLRWVMTRRVIIALGVVVIMVLGSLKLYSNTVREQDQEAKRRAATKSATAAAAPVDATLRTDGIAGEMLVKEGDNPGFVSLG